VGKQPGKKTTKSSAPSTTLKEILELLDMSYDSELGVLSGDLTRQIPQVEVLESLKRSLVKLSDQLEIVSNSDEGIIHEVHLSQEKETIQEDREETEEPVSVDAEAEVVEPETQSEVKTEEHGEEDGDAIMVDVEKQDTFENGADKVAALEPTQDRRMSVDRIENDPSVRNPKSEFVTSQTLPAAALVLGLFNEEDGGLQQTGEAFLKKRYGVASYPRTDLKDKLPGSIPDQDFSKSKPSNQVQFATFQTFFENFYRNFADDDIKYLKSKFNLPDSLANDPSYDPNITPYLIPDLGALYSDVWNEEEGAGSYSPPVTRITLESVEPKRSSNELTDDSLETESVSCGPLVSRLLSAILKDEKIDAKGDDDDDTRRSATSLPDQQGWKVTNIHADYSTLEERLKRELKYIGIFMNLDNDASKDEDGDDQGPDWLKPEDDEVSTELRTLQNELRLVSKRNNKRKRILIPLIEQQLAWQEYNSILDDLEKQVDQAYLKRIRVPKNKKRKTGTVSVPPSVQTQLQQQAAQQAAANSAVKSLLEKRMRWIEKIGPLFDRGDGTDGLKKYPKESVFDIENLDEDEEEDYEEGDELMLQQDNQ
jgi:transcriptional adapter 3